MFKIEDKLTSLYPVLLQIPLQSRKGMWRWNVIRGQELGKGGKLLPMTFCYAEHKKDSIREMFLIVTLP